MPARAAWRRLSAIVPLTVAAVVCSTLALTPTATAVGHTRSGATLAQHSHVATLPPIAERINEAADIAVAHIGDPYKYGAEGPDEFDCSGLTMYSYDHAQLSLPRTAAEQYAAVRHILKGDMIRGDLVFFHDTSGHVYHVGLFLYWDDRHIAVIVHAPYTGQVVHKETVWTGAWYAGTRRP